MRSGLISVTFVIPEPEELEQGIVPHLFIDGSNLLQEFEDSEGSVALSRIIDQQQEAEPQLGLMDLFEEYICEYEDRSQPEACEELAQYLERLANDLRVKGERLSKNFMPRSSLSPRIG